MVWPVIPADVLLAEQRGVAVSLILWRRTGLVGGVMAGSRGGTRQVSDQVHTTWGTKSYRQSKL
ncbi:hypothetical protein [Actinoplanes sp. NPDC049265]|uniref:hypothetical protein n=1 Tax=Actinoplanes sp. NPDC049265 TaxID=3363902 RepID=UPI003723DBF0